MKKLTLILLIITLLLSGCMKTAAERYEEQLDLGIRYLSEGNYEQASVAFNEAIEIDPKIVDAYVQLADAYIESDLPELATLTLLSGTQSAVDGEGNSPKSDLYSNLADLYITQQEPEKAAETVYEGFLETGDSALEDKKNDLLEYQTTESMQSLIEKGVYSQEDMPSLINADYLKMLHDGNGTIKEYFNGKDVTFRCGADMHETGLVYMSYFYNPYYGNDEYTKNNYLSFTFADKGWEDWDVLIQSGVMGDATSDYNGFPDDWQILGVSCTTDTGFKDVFPNMPDELAEGNKIENLNSYLGITAQEEFTPGVQYEGHSSFDHYSYSYTVDGYDITVGYSEIYGFTKPSIHIAEHVG